MIKAPGNVSMLFSFLAPVANFDFNIDSLLEKIFKFKEDDIENFPHSYDLIGYGNNAILNMGSIFVVNML